MVQARQRVYAQPVRQVPVDLAKAAVLYDPTVVKYTNDLEALGARHCFDGRAEPASSNDSYVRIYVLPEARSYFFFSFLRASRSHHYFPARPVFLLKTYFDDGHRLYSASTLGFERLHTPNCTARHLADEYDVEQALESHQRTVAKLIAEGRTVKRLMPAEELVDLTAQEHAEAATLRKVHGYFTLRGAIRQAFDLPRPEFRPD
jgi:hypothetical protein